MSTTAGTEAQVSAVAQRPFAEIPALQSLPTVCKCECGSG